ncbi:hypothetical protein GRF29_19g1751719 [Pseudopithomyces chartarum]|uniref:Gfd2/YDR514C-like C-terminal domain-containing protein n=1 Tax=Pseudopithomyces chartarum TaxID=1892770 RepID=A0AAN6RL24_9PLEO|nr:hypothetical protein GRF29_19g1751719 [Pseudopithomyces chartarum]
MNSVADVNNTQLVALSQFYSETLQSGKLRHVDMMAHTLGLKEHEGIFQEHRDILKRCVFRSIDLEWFELGPQRITEIGIAMLNRCGSTSKPITKIQHMRVYHMRLKETAHLVNSLKCEGHPEDFSFGKTTFVTSSEAKQALNDSLVPRDLSGNLKPMVLIGHAVDNDIDVLREKFDFDLAALGNIVMILDTQVMASELGMNGQRKMRLGHILQQFHITEPYLHNAGNDAGQTMVAAALLAGEYATGKGRYADANRGDVNHVKALVRKHGKRPRWGVPRFCTNCESTEHMVGGCPNQYWCQRCAAVPNLVFRANTHPAAKCGLPETPCKKCVDSKSEYREYTALTHFTEDCHVDEQMAEYWKNCDTM